MPVNMQHERENELLNQLDPEKLLKEIPNLHEQSRSVSRWIHKWVMEGGRTRRKAADVLHGTWLGHPLHPVLTDLTIGAWLFGALFDLLGLFSRSRWMEKAADSLILTGNAAAVPTALAGLADYSTVPPRVMATGAAHGLMNASGLALNLLSSFLRRSGNRSLGVLLTGIALSILTVSAWLGGELSYKYRIGINKVPKAPEPKGWKEVLDAQDLPEGAHARIDVDGAPVLLYHYAGQVYAAGAVCGHEGGPLDEGDFEGACVTCPWHHSVYDLRDGSVVHGPTTYAVPSYAVRQRVGKIEVRLQEQPVLPVGAQSTAALRE
jgi:nitrite reductase/ring-hydroxylating ferredoxin subunit/uncharacterized membrane protein